MAPVEPASSYVVTVATGDYTRTTNTSQSGVEISYWVPSERPGLATGLESAAAGLDWLEALLGPYPFDSLGFLLVDSQSGMETQTMITLGATDYTTSTAVLVHEMAHQWYGDEVTPDDWRDVWMNEGMAMYLQGCWQAEAGRPHRRRGDGRVRRLRGALRAGPARPRRTTRRSSARATSTTAPP